MYSFWSYASLKFVGAGRGHVLLQQYVFLVLVATCVFALCTRLTTSSTDRNFLGLQF